MSLTVPHKIWTTAGGKPYQVAKARIQLLLLSSQYPCAKLSRHWSSDNPMGICSNTTCQDHQLVESPEHILIHCPSYIAARQHLVSLQYELSDQVSQSLITRHLFTEDMMQLLLDCSALPMVIRAAQVHGPKIFSSIFYYSRTWCFSIHRSRMKRLNKWNFRWYFSKPYHLLS